MAIGLCLTLLATVLMGVVMAESSRDNPTQQFGFFTRPARRSAANYVVTVLALFSAGIAFTQFRDADFSIAASALLVWAGPLVVCVVGPWCTTGERAV